MSLNINPFRFFIWAALSVILSIGPVMVVHAQLEEIIVTAQRREQSLQDVPVSLQTFQGDMMERSGFDTLNELTYYAPGLVVKSTSEEQGLILRGSGTQSKNLGIEQGVPTFIDGVHMGRGSQVLNSYMDLERVEVLKGPQPVFFGQNAAAGALNIETRKPGDTWDGYVSGDYGRFGKLVLEGAVGGPVNDTFGFRVAAKMYRLEGFMRDWWTGDKFPQREYKTVRLTTVWRPIENFEASWKFEISRNNLGPRVEPVVLDQFSTTPFLADGNSALHVGLLSANVPPVDQEIGQFTRLGKRYGPTFINPRVESDAREAAGLPRLTEASASEAGVVLDFTQCQREGGLQVMGGQSGGIDPVRPTQFESCNMTDESGSRPYHAIMDLTYTLNNGIEITSKTAYSDQKFWNSPYNSGGGAFALNNRARGEFFSQWSEELRVSSAVGGQFEWMAGVYWQDNDLAAWSDAYRANWRNQIRMTRTEDDSRWLSAFATVTYNINEQFSLDVGARYTDVHKEGRGINRIGEWFVANPDDPNDIVRLPFGADLTQGNAGRRTASEQLLIDDPWLVNASIVGRSVVTDNCDTLLGRNHPAGRITGQNCATVENTIDDDSFDPQVVLRYRPTEDMSFYAKYATSFKSGAFDMAVSNVPENVEDFIFGPEEYETYEAGARGTFLGGRMAGELTAFFTDINGVQVSFVDRVLDRNVTKNIAKQESKGIEGSLQFAATDRMTIGAYLAFLDATVVEFDDAVCTEDERVTGNCRSEQDSIDLVGDDSLEGTTDRSGAPARNAPDWQFSGNVRYELPTFIEGFTSNVNALVYGTDSYTTDRSFSDVVDFPSSWDVSLSYEVGDVDGNWTLLLYGRNLVGNTQRYNPELDIAGDGLLESSAQTSLSNFASYGARIKYNFF